MASLISYAGVLNYNDFIFRTLVGQTRGDEFDVSFTAINQPIQISL